MRPVRTILVVVAALILVGLIAPSQTRAQAGPAYLRAVHFLTGGPKVDIYLDGKAVLTNLGYQDATTYVPVEAGLHDLSFGVAGQGIGTAPPIKLQAASLDFFTFVFSGVLADKDLNIYVTSESGLAKANKIEFNDNVMPVLFVNGASKATGKVDVYLDDALVGTVDPGASIVAVAPLKAFGVRATAAGDKTKVLESGAGIGYRATLGVMGLTGSGEKFSVVPAYSAGNDANKWLTAQRDRDSILKLSTLVDAIESAKLGDALAAPAAMTIFAPENAAFVNMDSAVLQDLASNPDKIANVLKFHVIGEPLSFSDVASLLVDGGSKKTLNGADLTFGFKDGKFMAGGTPFNVASFNIHTTNAVIHIIDAVLIPPAK